MGLSDWLRAADQIQSACCGGPGQTHETGHGGGEVAHLHGLEKHERQIFHTGKFTAAAERALSFSLFPGVMALVLSTWIATRAAGMISSTLMEDRSDKDICL